MDSNNNLEENNKRYKKLENSVSSDPEKMYVGDENSDEMDDKFGIKNPNGMHLMEDLYKMFITKQGGKKKNAEEYQSLEVDCNSEIETGYISVNFKATKSTVENSIIEKYVKSDEEKNCEEDVDPDENKLENHHLIDEKIISDKEKNMPDEFQPFQYDNSLCNNFFECSDDKKSTSDTINYEFYNSHEEPNLEQLRKTNYCREEDNMITNRNDGKQLGKYGIYALSTIIVMSSVYLANML